MKIIKCPKCGSNNVKIGTIDYMDWYYGYCHSCKLTGYSAKSKELVIKKMKERYQKLSLNETSKEIKQQRKVKKRILNKRRKSMLIQLRPMYGENYKSGQLFFTRKEKGLISRGIDFHTRDFNVLKKKLLKTTHVGICIGQGVGIEMQPTGFKQCDLWQYFGSNETRIIFREPKKLDELGFEPIYKAIKDITAKGGVKYDFKLILGFMLADNPLSDRLMPKKLRDWIRKKFNSKNRWVCSEAVQIIYKKARFHSSKQELITPQELFYADWLKPLKTRMTEKIKKNQMKKAR